MTEWGERGRRGVEGGQVGDEALAYSTNAYLSPYLQGFRCFLFFRGGGGIVYTDPPPSLTAPKKQVSKVHIYTAHYSLHLKIFIF